ncbi:MAG: sugar ABC transporter permease [Candidatus Bathyarchaeia archaeon]
MYVIFWVFPIINGIWLSFFDVSVRGEIFKGLENFSKITKDNIFWLSLKNVLIYAGVSVFGLIASLLLALIINSSYLKSNRLKILVQAIIFLPWVVSWVSLGLMWTWLLRSSMTAYFLSTLRNYLPFDPERSLLAQQSTAIWTVSLIVVWRNLGYNTILFLVGLKAIPKEIIEASLVDGADSWSRFRRIILPLMKPMIIFVAITTLIGSFQIYDPIRVMTDGNPAWTTTSPVHWIFKNVIEFWKIGYGSAMGVIIVIIVFTLSLLQYKVVRKYL